jgi:murein DD-endopeptidase MepM/ murein hydrolase activator NlpD
LLGSSTLVYDERGFMQIEPATCPACGGAFDPLRAQAVTVIDGRVRAFCSAACRERGIAPAAPKRSTTDAHAAIVVPPSSVWSSVRTEQRVLIAAATVTLLAFVALLVTGRRSKAPAPSDSASGQTVAKENNSAPAADATENDSWLQPLAGITRRVAAHDRRLFYGREGIPASECTLGRCAIDIEGPAGAVVMAVHDGVVEAVEREPDAAARQELEGRFIRIIHKGGAFTSSYLQLDGIREDLRPGVPVKMGEPIGTVLRAGAAARSHFRFAISARNNEGAMLFIDPQPLLALWPIRRQAAMSLRAMERGPRREPLSTSRGAPQEKSRASLDSADSRE